MDCTRFRKYVGAFADGELDVQQNLDALEHLNMCPACAARATELGALKGAMKRVFASTQTPQQLTDRILAVMENDGVPQPVARFRHSDGRAKLPWRLTIPLGIAASLLVVLGIWRLSPIGIGADEPAHATLTARFVADTRQQHLLCTRNGHFDHHAESLPRDLKKIANIMGRDLGLRVAVPDLSTYGFELAGANWCGIRGRCGAHILYRSSAPPVTALSLFTVGRQAPFTSGREPGRAEGDVFVASDDSLRIIAWHDGRQAYVACADLPESALLDLTGAIRTSVAWRQSDTRAVLASIR